MSPGLIRDLKLDGKRYQEKLLCKEEAIQCFRADKLRSMMETDVL
jgi:hypothetical protein